MCRIVLTDNVHWQCTVSNIIFQRWCLGSNQSIIIPRESHSKSAGHNRSVYSCVVDLVSQYRHVHQCTYECVSTTHRQCPSPSTSHCHTLCSHIHLIFPASPFHFHVDSSSVFFFSVTNLQFHTSVLFPFLFPHAPFHYLWLSILNMCLPFYVCMYTLTAIMLSFCTSDVTLPFLLILSPFPPWLPLPLLPFPDSLSHWKAKYDNREDHMASKQISDPHNMTMSSSDDSLMWAPPTSHVTVTWPCTMYGFSPMQRNQAGVHCGGRRSCFWWGNQGKRVTQWYSSFSLRP